MVTARRFCRFRTEGHPGGDLEPLPSDGMCLSVFLVLGPPNGPTQVLLGKVRADALGWVAAGALDPGRALRSAGHWMLPSSHLMVFESPDDAARRVLREQLGLDGVELRPPVIVSETYGRSAGTDPHWDLHFLYRGTAASEPPRFPSLWERLEYLDPRRLGPSEFARSHGDILEFAGLTLGRDSG